MGSRFKIGVMGSSEDLTPPQIDLARAVGGRIAFHGCILMSGACPGLTHEAAQAADERGGICIGFSPAMNLQEHVGKYNFPSQPYILVFTGMGGKGRNLIGVRSCDAVVFIKGRMGTLNEFTIAYDEAHEGKVIAVLEGSGGLSDKLLPLATEIGKRSKATIIAGRDPVELIDRVVKALANSLA